jgi:hypothetical protein
MLTGHRLANRLHNSFLAQNWNSVSDTAKTFSAFWTPILDDWREACSDVRLLLGDEDEVQGGDEEGDVVSELRSPHRLSSLNGDQLGK